jgi:flagellar motor switch protein FliM
VSRLLSQEELSSLLEPASGGLAAGSGPQAPPAVPYNFRRPDRVSKEQLRSLHFLHDRFAHNVSTSMSAFLRSVTDVSIVSAEQLAYSEFLASLPEQTAFYAVSIAPLEGLMALELNQTVGITLVDRMLGGTGVTEGVDRPLTEIEQNVIDSVVKIILDTLSEAWRAVTEVEFRIHGRETRPQMLNVMGPNENVMLMAFDMRFAEVRGQLNLCIPTAVIEAVGERFEQGAQRTQRQPTPQEEAWLSANLGRVAIPVTAMIASTLSAGELLKLRRGDVLGLGHSVQQPIDIQIGQATRYLGRMSTDGGALAIRVESRADAAAGATA